MDPLLSIVVVEDHQLLRESVVDVLTAAGHHVFGVDSAEALSDEVALARIDVAVVDIQLPGESGLKLMQRLRLSQQALGIIAMTALSTIQDRVAGYESGADVYLVKPVDPRELLAAVARCGQRSRHGLRASAPAASLQFDQRRRCLTGTGTEQRLSADEAVVLAAFTRAPDQRLENWQLLELLKIEATGNDKARVEVRVSRLRKKLLQSGAAPDCLQPVRGTGYQLCVQLQVH
jgi:DNA-binding response OmpR family regulator